MLFSAYIELRVEIVQHTENWLRFSIKDDERCYISVNFCHQNKTKLLFHQYCCWQSIRSFFFLFVWWFFFCFFVPFANRSFLCAAPNQYKVNEKNRGKQSKSENRLESWEKWLQQQSPFEHTFTHVFGSLRSIVLDARTHQSRTSNDE